MKKSINLSFKLPGGDSNGYKEKGYKEEEVTA